MSSEAGPDTPQSPGGPRLRRADAERSRQRILSAAGRLFERDPGTSMTDVAAAAGVGRSTLHRHFPSRRELWQALANRPAGERGRGPEARAPLGDPANGRSDATTPAGARSTGPQPALGALDVLDRLPPHLVADQLVSEARRVAGVPVALYLVDADGSALLWLAGDAEHLPARIELRLGLGPEIARDSLPDLYAQLESRLPGCSPAPLWLRDRATGILLAVGTPQEPLARIAREGAAALELANRYTDVLEAARRRRMTSLAAEMQLDLLPCARVVRVPGGQLAGGVLPSPEVGGDWFDWADNHDGSWLAIAETDGEGAVTAGRAALSLGALRAARRRGLGLEGVARAVHEVVHDLPSPFGVRAVIAHWGAAVATLTWIGCGHAPPLLLGADGSLEELGGHDDVALGLGGRERAFRVQERRIRRGERVVVCSDGVLERRGADGARFGLAGIRAAVSGVEGISAPATARSILHAAVAASTRPREDDAAVLVLAVG